MDQEIQSTSCPAAVWHSAPGYFRSSNNVNIFSSHIDSCGSQWAQQGGDEDFFRSLLQKIKKSFHPNCKIWPGLKGSITRVTVSSVSQGANGPEDQLGFTGFSFPPRPHTASRPVVSLTRRDEDDEQWGYWGLRQAEGASSREVRQNPPSAWRDGIFLHLRKGDAAAELKRSIMWTPHSLGTRTLKEALRVKDKDFFAGSLGNRHCLNAFECDLQSVEYR